MNHAAGAARRPFTVIAAALVLSSSSPLVGALAGRVDLTDFMVVDDGRSHWINGTIAATTFSLGIGSSIYTTGLTVRALSIVIEGEIFADSRNQVDGQPHLIRLVARSVIIRGSLSSANGESGNRMHPNGFDGGDIAIETPPRGFVRFSSTALVASGAGGEGKSEINLIQPLSDRTAGLRALGGTGGRGGDISIQGRLQVDNGSRVLLGAGGEGGVALADWSAGDISSPTSRQIYGWIEAQGGQGGRGGQLHRSGPTLGHFANLTSVGGAGGSALALGHAGLKGQPGWSARAVGGHGGWGLTKGGDGGKAFAAAGGGGIPHPPSDLVACPIGPCQTGGFNGQDGGDADAVGGHGGAAGPIAGLEHIDDASLLPRRETIMEFQSGESDDGNGACCGKRLPEGDISTAEPSNSPPRPLSARYGPSIVMFADTAEGADGSDDMCCFGTAAGGSGGSATAVAGSGTDGTNGAHGFCAGICTAGNPGTNGGAGGRAKATGGDGGRAGTFRTCGPAVLLLTQCRTEARGGNAGEALATSGDGGAGGQGGSGGNCAPAISPAADCSGSDGGEGGDSGEVGRTSGPGTADMYSAFAQGGAGGPAWANTVTLLADAYGGNSGAANAIGGHGEPAGNGGKGGDCRNNLLKCTSGARPGVSGHVWPSIAQGLVGGAARASGTADAGDGGSVGASAFRGGSGGRGGNGGNCVLTDTTGNPLCDGGDGGPGSPGGHSVQTSSSGAGNGGASSKITFKKTGQGGNGGNAFGHLDPGSRGGDGGDGGDGRCGGLGGEPAGPGQAPKMAGPTAGQAGPGPEYGTAGSASQDPVPASPGSGVKGSKGWSSGTLSVLCDNVIHSANTLAGSALEIAGGLTGPGFSVPLSGLPVQDCWDLIGATCGSIDPEGMIVGKLEELVQNLGSDVPMCFGSVVVSPVDTFQQARCTRDPDATCNSTQSAFTITYTCSEECNQDIIVDAVAAASDNNGPDTAHASISCGGFSAAQADTGAAGLPIDVGQAVEPFGLMVCTLHFDWTASGGIFFGFAACLEPPI